MQKHIPFFIGLGLSLILLWPLFSAPMFTHHDDVQVIRLHQMHSCIKDLQIPCRWVPDLGAGYGYPLFNYYAPLPYYVGEVFYLLTGSLFISVKLMFAVSFIGSFIFMYLLARKLWGDWGGALSGLFYSYAPYHALNFYTRGAMGEMWGMLFFPAVIWGAIRLREKITVNSMLVFGGLVAGLITSHNLSALIFMPIILLAIVIIYFSIKDLKKIKLRFLGFAIGSLVFGFTLSAFYWIPAYFERDLVHVDSTTYGYFSYTEHFKGFRKLFLDRSWEYGTSVREIPGGERDTLSYQIGWIHLIGFALALAVAGLLWRKDKRYSLIILLLAGLTVISIFMIHPRSLFIWSLFDSQLKFLQFPWRFLLLVTFFISLISGSFLFWLEHNKHKNKSLLVFIVFIAGLVALNFSYFRPKEFLYISEQELLSGTNLDYQLERSILDYLPKSAKEPPADLAPNSYTVLAGDAVVANHHEGSNWFNFNVVTTGHTIIRISNYYFPEWKIFVNGEETPFEYEDNNLGLMSIILGAGEYQIEGRLYNTPIRNIANALSALSWTILISILLIKSAKFKKAVKYYLKAYK